MDQRNRLKGRPIAFLIGVICGSKIVPAIGHLIYILLIIAALVFGFGSGYGYGHITKERPSKEDQIEACTELWNTSIQWQNKVHKGLKKRKDQK